MNLHGRSLLKEIDFTADEFVHLVDLGGRLRLEKRMGLRSSRLVGRNIALIFEKTSTRTRAAFEVAAHDEGAHVTYLGPGDSQLGLKESMKDTARVLGRMFDGIEFRGAAQETVETLGAYSGVPVWNGLTDDWHPTQMLADILTMRDHTRKPLAEVGYCYLGDGRNNTANSLLVTGAMLGIDVRICAPGPLQPSARVQGIAAKLAAGSGARLAVTADVPAAVAGVDYVYTDVWLSMGEPAEEMGRADRPAAPLPGEPRRDGRHRESGGEVHALPARPAQPGDRDRAAPVRQARTGGPRSDRGGLRIARLHRVRPGGEPAAHDQGGHGRHGR